MKNFVSPDIQNTPSENSDQTARMCRLPCFFAGRIFPKVPFLMLKLLLLLKLGIVIELAHDKTNKMACVPREGSDQPGHQPCLIKVFAVQLMGS